MAKNKWETKDERCCVVCGAAVGGRCLCRLCLRLSRSVTSCLTVRAEAAAASPLRSSAGWSLESRASLFSSSSFSLLAARSIPRLALRSPAKLQISSPHLFNQTVARAPPSRPPPTAQVLPPCALSTSDLSHHPDLAPAEPMRRIAAVFASKRTDRSDAASTAASASSTTDAPQPPPKSSSSKRFFRSLSRKSKAPLDPVVNRLSSTDLHPPSSSSSSSGAPTTPDDDRGSLLRVPANKAWLPLPPVDPRMGSFHHVEPAPHDQSRFNAAPRPPATPSTFDTEEDESSTEESSVAPDLSKAPERAVPLTAPAYLLALTSNNLRLPYAPPPLLHVHGRPMFPRSCNPRRSLACSDCLETTMHRKKLQRRLQRGDLSPAEARSIAPFAGRRNAIKERYQLHLDDVAVRVGRVQSHSPGLKRWAERPCFEDRVLVLLPENIPTNPHSEPRWTRVAPATGFGVAALEFSVALELLADLYEDNVASEPGQSPAPDASALGYLRLDTQLTLDLAPTPSLSPTTLSPSSSVSPPSPATMHSPTSAAAAAAPSPKPAQPSCESVSPASTLRI